MFNYIFYRLYKLYRVKEKESAKVTIFNTVGIVSLLQVLLLFSIIMSVNGLVMYFSSTHYNFLSILRRYSKLDIKIIVVILFISWDTFNYFYYKKRYKKLIIKYKNHPMNKKFKPWMLYFISIGFLAFPFFLNKFLKFF